MGRSRYQGVQTALKGISEYGCYFLSLCSVAEDWLEWSCGGRVDLIDAVHSCQGFIDNDWFVHDASGILEALTGASWSMKILSPYDFSQYKLAENEYTIEKWYNSRTGYNHFRRRDTDTLESSVTVKEGKLVDIYIFTAE